ncbi:MAG: hypothetical protein HN576_03610 [Bacteriovoracaceae bacterium]|jgi:hypothetical protein|nr:hypothetical protein [Bacteriovoracaceae bacterium]
MKSLNSTKLIIISFAIILLGIQSAFCEYRVYQYYVKSTYSSPKDKTQYLVTSSLDPVSYVTYHGGPDTIEVDLLRTWTCEGYTGSSNELCDSPLQEGKNSRGVASEGVGI